MRAHNYIRNKFLKGEENDLFDHTLRVMVPPRWIDANEKKAYAQHMKSLVGLYFSTRRRKVTISKINEEVGLGVTARMNLVAGASIYELNGESGTRLAKTIATDYVSSVEKVCNIKGGEEDEEDPEHTKRYYALLGTVAFLNHACENCSNCYTCDDEDPTGTMDWLFVKTKRNISAGEELTVTYSDDCGYTCRTCCG